VLFSQSDTSIGIQWTTNFSWGEVLTKAKRENKYIFLDCFATWCKPCHVMDKDVYTNSEVGNALNEKFISVKVQMNKTAYDDEIVKKWYYDARQIEKDYTVSAFPTFLFFSSEGKPLHRAVGYKEPAQFISLITDAQNPEKQYYALLNNYKPGTIDTSELKGLSRAMSRLGGDLGAMMAIEYLEYIPKKERSDPDNLLLMTQFANNSKMQKIAAQYISELSSNTYLQKKNLTLIGAFSKTPSVRKTILHYLQGLKKVEMNKELLLLTVFSDDSTARTIANKYIRSVSVKEIFTSKGIDFITAFTQTSKDEGFEIFRKYANTIDKIKGFKYAHLVTDEVIIQEEYNLYFPNAIKAGEDNIPWQTIAKRVTEKYGSELAAKLEIAVRAQLYGALAKMENKYWAEYIKYYIEKIEKTGYDTTHPQVQFWDALVLNNFVFNAIFYHSNDANQFKVGLKWMEGVIRRKPNDANHIDTYANLLYKSGSVEKAIEWQIRAVQIASTDKEQKYLLPSLNWNLSKMQKGIPTWLKEN
jgi:thioredoxin-related protein